MMKSEAAFSPNHTLPEVPTVAATKTDERPWRVLVELIAAEYPFCTMQGVNVVDGYILSCSNIEKHIQFDPNKNVKAAASPGFGIHCDDNWKALKSLCEKIRTGRLAELKFHNGKPTSAWTSEGGRRFKQPVKAGLEFKKAPRPHAD